jgi:flagellar basal-body rod protein FlgC
MKKLILILPILLTGCAHQSETFNKDLMTYCQDLNVLYLKSQLTASNIANVNTTRTESGGYYKRQFAKNCKDGFCEVAVDDSAPILKYEPKHPDANKEGYVAYPPINLAQEEADKLYWMNVYATVVASSPVPANFFFKDSRADLCFNKYPQVKEHLNFSEYLGRKTNGSNEDDQSERPIKGLFTP